ncbi:MAG: LacI family DNA-binding transcriptional regulator [Dehalococcoidia bacterium]
MGGDDRPSNTVPPMALAPAAAGLGRVVTLRDVAQRAGVDVSTASRALTGRRRVTPAIAKRVRSAAASLGYSPNVTARNLRMARTMTLGLIFPKLNSPTSLEFAEGLSSGIEEEGYSLMLTTARGEPEHFRTLVQRLFERRVDALFIATPPDLGTTLQAYENAGVPVLVLFARGLGPESLPLFTAMEDEALRQAAARLAALGHRRVIYFGMPQSVPSVRTTWLQQSAERSGLTLTIEMVPHEEHHAGLYDRVARHLTVTDRATVFFSDLSVLPRLMHVLNQMGLRIPADLSLVAFGESPWTLEFGVPIASISHDMLQLGRLAAATILDWLQGSRPADVVSVGGGVWVERDSIGPAPPQTVQRATPIAESIAGSNRGSH